MKLNNIAKLLIVIALTIKLSSCTEPIGKTAYFIIKNNSSHNIKIELLQSDEIDSSLILSVDNIVNYSITTEVGPPPFTVLGADSLIVIFSDTVEITHHPWETGLSKNIMLENSWDVEIENENKKVFKYIFTEDDFIEALEK